MHLKCRKDPCNGFLIADPFDYKGNMVSICPKCKTKNILVSQKDSEEGLEYFVTSGYLDPENDHPTVLGFSKN